MLHNRVCLPLLASFVILVFGWRVSSGAVIKVPGDEVTVEDAIDIAALTPTTLDTIEVEHAHVESLAVNVDAYVSISSETPTAVVKFLERMTISASDVSLRGIILEEGVEVGQSGTLLESCVVTATGVEPAISVILVDAEITLRDVRIEDALVGLGGTGILTHCTPCCVVDMDAVVEDCEFIDLGLALRTGCASVIDVTSSLFDSCDFVVDTLAVGGSVFERNIVREVGTVFGTCPNSVKYNVFYNYDDIGCSISWTDNIDADPLFCAGLEDTEEYTLRIDSPAIAENNSFGKNVGPFPVECAFGTLQRDTVVPQSAQILMIQDVIVPAGSTLTIGNDVTFAVDDDDDSSGGNDTSLNELCVQGGLIVAGGSIYPVTFESGAGSPASGDWYGIWIDEDADADLDYATIKHAVTGVRVFADADDVDITNSTFDYIEVDCVYAAGADTTDVLLDGNTFNVRGGVGIAATAENLTVSGSNVIDDKTGDSLYGIELGATSSGQVISDATSKNFDAGSALYVTGNANTAPTVKTCTLKDSKYGVYVTTSDIKIGTTSSTDANQITGNTTAGILATGSSATPVIRYNNIASNTNGLWAQSSADPDAGTSGDGNNKITGSSNNCIWNRNAGGTPQVQAEGNYFGACSGGFPPSCWTGDVNISSYQCTAPFSARVEMEPSADFGFGGRVALLAGHPNPMQQSGQISFEIRGDATTATVQIFDISGRLVRDFGQRSVSPGVQQVRWNGHADDGAHVGSGVYFVRLTLADGESVVSKLIVTR